MARCPGQDMRYWTPEDIFDVRCPYCANEIEFWKDEPMRLCSQCQREIRNPRIDLGCAKWCKHADQCLGRDVDGQVAAPIVERLAALLERRYDSFPEKIKKARALCCYVDDKLAVSSADPRVTKAAAILAAVIRGSADTDEEILELLCRTGVEEDEAQRVIVVLRNVLNGQASSPEEVLLAEAIRAVNGGTSHMTSSSQT